MLTFIFSMLLSDPIDRLPFMTNAREDFVRREDESVLNILGGSVRDK